MQEFNTFLVGFNLTTAVLNCVMIGHYIKNRKSKGNA